jgi:hypothetical protein
MTACLFLALGAAVFAWQRTHVREEALEGRREVRRAARRLALAAIPAVLVTMWALMDGVAHRNRLLALNAAMGGNADSGSKDASKGAQGHGTGGFVSVILWPYPEKKQISAPIEESSVLAPGSKRPVVIRFDGQYWYMQPPDQRPGPLAHQAHGTPLDTHIASNNRFPLTMEAHQFLGAPIRVLRCRGIEVEIENRDNDPGAISMAVLLRDSSSARTPALYIGEQPIVTKEPGNFRIKSAPVAETLRFAVPAQARVRKFDEITVMILPDAGHQRVGPRIGIDEFALLPR